MTAGRAVFAGCARNCAAHLGAVLQNVELMAGLFAESAFVFVENDSADATKAMLKAWCEDRANARVVDLDGMAQDCPIWTERLARARNAYLEVATTAFGHYDYLFVLDMDERNILPIDPDQVEAAIGFLAADGGRAGAFANQTGAYYDMWALRCDGWQTGDIWEEVLDLVVSAGVSDEKAFRTIFGQRIRSIAPAEAPIAVLSPFGGLGVYRMASVLANTRRHQGIKPKVLPTTDGVREMDLQTCEHVSFNAGFGDMGQSLHILPSLINGHNPNAYKLVRSSFNPSAFRGLIGKRQ